jgi:hypothetical protein
MKATIADGRGLTFLRDLKRHGQFYVNVYRHTGHEDFYGNFHTTREGAHRSASISKAYRLAYRLRITPRTPGEPRA